MEYVDINQQNTQTVVMPGLRGFITETTKASVHWESQFSVRVEAPETAWNVRRAIAAWQIGSQEKSDGDERGVILWRALMAKSEAPDRRDVA